MGAFDHDIIIIDKREVNQPERFSGFECFGINIKLLKEVNYKMIMFFC